MAFEKPRRFKELTNEELVSALLVAADLCWNGWGKSARQAEIDLPELKNEILTRMSV